MTFETESANSFALSSLFDISSLDAPQENKIKVVLKITPDNFKIVEVCCFMVVDFIIDATTYNLVTNKIC